MRPSGNSFSRKPTEEELDYDVEVEKRTKSFTSDVSEVMAKLKGGSLQDFDKRVITNKLIDEILKWEIITKKSLLIRLIEQNV
jgi:hypothetical protein